VVKSGRMRWAGDVARIEDVWSPEWKQPIGRVNYRWHDNIEVNLKMTALWYGLRSYCSR